MIPLAFLLLLLGFCTAVQQNNDQVEFNRGLYFFGRNFTAGLMSDRGYNNTRQKRALSSFAQAWKALLRTTIGYRRMPLLGSDHKFFAKIGSLEQAKQDFLSLGPTDVVRTGFGYKGHVGNEVIELHTNAPDGAKIPRAMLHVVDGEDAKIAYGVQSSSKAAREIFYFDKPEDMQFLRLGFFPWH